MQSDDLLRVAALLGGDLGWPAIDGEPLFDEPWQGRAFAMAFELLDRTGRSWGDFRERLVAAIGGEPDRPYYESWLVALEQLALDVEVVDQGAIDHARNHAAAYRYHEHGVGDIEAFPFRLDADHRHAELFRVWRDGAPASWGLRVYNGGGDLALDMLLASPFLDDDGRPLDEPDWSRLACWDELRRRLLGLGPDPADRRGHT